MSEHEAYYRRLAEDRYDALHATESPWSHMQQHGGPPLALAAVAMLRAHPAPERRPVSIVLDFLGAIPLAEVTVATSVRRAGARIDLLEARMDAGGRAFAEVRMWRAKFDDALDVPATGEPEAAFDLPGPQPQRFFDGLERWGYGESIEWRFTRGSIATLGPVSLWTRVRGELVEGEGTEPLARALVIADSANGVSAILPMRDWLFVPTRIAVTFRRDPAGEWIRIDAETICGPDGRAVAHATLFDERGHVGTVDQALFVSRR